MKNKTINRFIFCFGSIFSIGLFINAGIILDKKENISFAFANSNPKEYYKNITDDLDSEELLCALQNLNKEKLVSPVGFNNMRNNYKYTDSAPNGYIYSFYSGKTYNASSLTREHVWPDSHGGNLIEDDIHMIRPATNDLNRARGNSFYVSGLNDSYTGWDPANGGNPTYRGDAARIIFYSVVAEPRFEIIDESYHSTSSDNNDYKMGKLSDLLKWHLMYPVSEREENRNLGAERLQGNRNPFIDHPEYVCKVWGNTNQITKDICSSYEETILKGVSLDVNDFIISEGDTYQLTAVTNPIGIKNITTSWMSSSVRVAKVDSNGLVTAVGVGKATIAIEVYNNDDHFVATAQVTVTANNNSSVNFNGCGGNIVTTSTVINTLAILGIFLIIYRQKRLNYRKKDF